MYFINTQLSLNIYKNGSCDYKWLDSNEGNAAAAASYYMLSNKLSERSIFQRDKLNLLVSDIYIRH